MTRRFRTAVLLSGLLVPGVAGAQSFPTDDPVVRRIWAEGMESGSQAYVDDLRNNATLAALLAYLASEDPQRVKRTQRVLPPDAMGRPQAWPRCGTPARSSGR